MMASCVHKVYVVLLCQAQVAINHTIHHVAEDILIKFWLASEENGEKHKRNEGTELRD